MSSDATPTSAAPPTTPEFEALWIDAHDTHELRERILRPGHPEDCDFPADREPSAKHAGAFDRDGRLVAIASIYRESRPADAPGGVEPRPEHAAGTAWRLRGMAAVEEVRGRGAGRVALERCIEHARAAGGELMWCNARTGAIGFYEAQGWTRLGEEFDVPKAGRHYVMELEL